jgi:hypothetical protein
MEWWVHTTVLVQIFCKQARKRHTEGDMVREDQYRIYFFFLGVRNSAHTSEGPACGAWESLSKGSRLGGCGWGCSCSNSPSLAVAPSNSPRTRTNSEKTKSERNLGGPCPIAHRKGCSDYWSMQWYLQPATAAQGKALLAWREAVDGVQ